MAYQPPLNGGRINASIGGNTQGTGNLISSGTMMLVGGPNITLSQAGNAVTISSPNGGGAANISFGVSSLGNTSGTTGLVGGPNANLILVGGNNITLSQAVQGQNATVTMSAPNQSVQTQNMVSMAGSTGNIVFSNSNNVTFGGNLSTITASASFSQSVQTQNLRQVRVSGNTAGATANISSGTMTLAGGNNITLSQAGNAVTISGGGGGVALANSQTTYTSGTANLVASGALTIASLTGQSFNLSVPPVSSLAGTGGITLSTTGSTIQINGGDAMMANIAGVRTRVNSTSWEPRPTGYKMVFTIGADPSPDDMVDGDVRIVPA